MMSIMKTKIYKLTVKKNLEDMFEILLVVEALY